MKILLLDIYPPVDYRISKDTNGGYGTGNDWGDSLFAKFLKRITKKNLDWPPVYAMYTISVLREKGHEIEYSRKYKDGFDLYIFTSSIVSHETEIKEIKALKNLNKKVMVIGSYAISNPEDYIRNNAIVIGNEPELYFLKNPIEKINLNEVKILSDFVGDIEIDNLPFPAWGDILKNNILSYGMLQKKAMIPILGIRGCPYSCFHYCVYPLAQGRKVRKRSPMNIVEEIIHWQKNYKVNHFVFRDPVFSIDRKHSIQVCKMLIEKKIKVQLTIETHLNNIDNEMLDLLKKAGLYMVKVGIESVEPEVLKASKRFTISEDKQIEVIRRIEKKGVRVVCHYIFGMVGDSYQTCINTIKYAKKLNTYIAQFSVFTPYPGTPVFNEYKDKIIAEKNEDFNQYRMVFDHNKLSSKAIRKILTIAYDSYYKRFTWLFKYLSYASKK